jgi:SCY1-like protein 2
MGSQLTSIFNISEKEVVMGGPSNVLRIYKATKKSSKNKVSLFTIKKKELKSDSKVLCEAIFEGVRKEVKMLTKLRHPSILHVMEPLGEDSGYIWFGTEPIEGSLKYLLETPSKQHLIPSEIELKAQLLELIETVVFLHNNAHLLHLAISPENIYLTADGKFKLAGFFFSQSTSSPSFHNVDYTLVSKNVSFVPHFGFTAPEVIKENTASTSSDVFSIGALLYTLLQAVRGDKASYFLDVKDYCTKQIYLDQIRNLNDEYASAKLNLFNSDAVDLLQKLLNRNPAERLKLHVAYAHSWLNDPKIKTLDYLEHLNEKEHQHKLQYLEGLMKVIDEFDNKVIERRILPTLASYLPMAKISVNILPPIITILEKDELCSKTVFYSSVWPQLQYICKCSEVSANILYLIINHPEVWLKFLSIQDFQSTLVVLYQKAINCGVTKIQEASLNALERFAKKIEYAILKTGFLPKIIKLVQGTNVNTLRIKCMESIASFSSFLDATTVKNTVLPILEKLSKSNTDGRLHLAMVRTIESFLKLFSHEELATTIIPLLLSMSVKGQFTKRQFSDTMKLIRTLVDKVDTTRLKVNVGVKSRNCRTNC